MEGITSFNQVEEYITFFRFQNVAYTFFWHIVFNKIRIMYNMYYIIFDTIVRNASSARYRKTQ